MDDYLGFVGEGRCIEVCSEEWVEEDDVDERSDGREVEVGRQVDQAKAVRKAADELEAADPLKPREKPGFNLVSIEFKTRFFVESSLKIPRKKTCGIEMPKFYTNPKVSFFHLSFILKLKHNYESF